VAANSTTSRTAGRRNGTRHKDAVWQHGASLVASILLWTDGTERVHRLPPAVAWEMQCNNDQGAAHQAVQRRVHNSPLLVLRLSKIKPDYTLSHHFLDTDFNIIMPCKPGFATRLY